MNEIIISLYVKELKTFDRKNGKRGQTLKIRSDSGYSCNLDCVDVDECDFSNIPVNKEVLIHCKPIFNVFNSVTKDGAPFLKNVLCLCAVGFDIELD